jgi:7-cyano-7-deazaguanine synthase in queuosine biosynthesis
MAASRSLILATGSLRSLICTAATLTGMEPARVVLYHIRDGRPNAGIRREYARKQAEHFKISKLVELDMPSIQSAQNTQPNPGQDHALARALILLAAVGHAAEVGIDRVIWPAQFNGDHQLIARTTEQALLIEHLAQLERANVPVIDLPILDLTDSQLIELGSQLDVPWHLAWTCDGHSDKPCLSCPSCMRRRQAFHIAGIVDPIDKSAPGKNM